MTIKKYYRISDLNEINVKQKTYLTMKKSLPVNIISNKQEIKKKQKFPKFLLFYFEPIEADWLL